MRSYSARRSRRRRERARVAIDAGDAHAAFEKGSGVPTAAERAVENGGSASQQRFDLRKAAQGTW
jgi:hypothetical protein